MPAVQPAEWAESSHCCHEASIVHEHVKRPPFGCAATVTRWERLWLGEEYLTSTTFPTAVAKAFALLSEEGIAKGVRRIVAVTATEAVDAIKLGETLRTRTVDAKQLSPDKLEREVAALKKASLLLY